jgi:nitric oxide reductase NorE protein
VIDWRAGEQLAGPALPARGTKLRGHIPGEIGIWIFAAGDLLVFALFFVVFVHERGKDVTGFDEARQSLSLTIGAINTLVLLTGSMLVVLGVHAARRQAGRLASKLFALTLLCGLAFVVGKIADYVHQADLGHSPATNDFFMYFFVLTWIHLLHLIVGMVEVGLMWRFARRPVLGPREIRNIEVCAVFWHLVDLLWLVLFALLYLMR